MRTIETYQPDEGGRNHETNMEIKEENQQQSVTYGQWRDTLAQTEERLAEVIEIARTAIEAIETIYGHAQFCDDCQSFEIAKQCRDEIHGWDRLNSLESDEPSHPSENDHCHPDGKATIEMNDRYDEIEAELPLGYLLDKCNDWDDFCEDAGLNPFLLNEGIADSTDTHPVKIATLRKHGVLR